MNARLLRREQLDRITREAMHRLLDAHFEGVTPEVFEADLAQKNWALLFEDGGELVGFSTMLMYAAKYHSRSISILYSGDTIMADHARHSSALARYWIDAVWRLHDNDERPLWWMLITSGYRTYRFLPVFWREYYPRHDAPWPEDVARLRDALASERFGERYHPATGVVQLEHAQPLRQAIRGIPPGKLRDPHVRFFAQANPGHVAGDELVCLAELTRSNLTPAGRRIVKAVRPHSIC